MQHKDFKIFVLTIPRYYVGEPSAIQQGSPESDGVIFICYDLSTPRPLFLLAVFFNRGNYAFLAFVFVLFLYRCRWLQC